MIKFELPLTICITTWRDERTIIKSFESVLDLADLIVIVYGGIKDIDKKWSDKTLDILKHLQIDYNNIFALIGQNSWKSIAEKLNTAWFESMGYFLRIRGNEVLSVKAKDELRELIPKSFDSGIPIISKNPENGNLEVRGCEVDYSKTWENIYRIPGGLFIQQTKALEMKCKIMQQ